MPRSSSLCFEPHRRECASNRHRERLSECEGRRAGGREGETEKERPGFIDPDPNWRKQVQDGLDSKFLESSAAVFGQFQDLCRQSALREQDTQRKLVRGMCVFARACLCWRECMVWMSTWGSQCGRQSDERQQVKLQALVAAFVPTVVQKALQVCFLI